MKDGGPVAGEGGAMKDYKDARCPICGEKKSHKELCDCWTMDRYGLIKKAVLDKIERIYAVGA